ncbi:DUF6527 family protein [Variovorax sp. 160MFSha2.1]|uniref:DUF6527 family protein n=1 Tax=Variovorax sp. 160MFSha2.1 TaxID=3158367 RepID=UPI003AAF4D8A
MKQRATLLNFRGLVEHRHDADEQLAAPGNAVLVRRGVDRSLALRCPDDCGETLTINLDRRTGPAWRVYMEGQSVSLYPSVWRHTGCKSHFIIWRSRIYWCDWDDPFLRTGEDFEQRVLEALTANWQPYATVAEHLSAVPWAVLSASLTLQARGLVQRGGGDNQHCFRLVHQVP